MTARFYINGRFLTQAFSGVQRYATEIVKQMDAQLAADPVKRDETWSLVTTQDARIDFDLKCIRTRRVGVGGGHLWDQTHLARAAADGSLISLGSSGPVLHRRHFVTIHDAAVFRHPENYSRPYRLFHKSIGHILSRTAGLITVSEFSRRELAQCLRLDPEAILVAPNGWQHLLTLAPPKPAPDGRPYFVTVGNLTTNKNLRVAVAAMALLEPGAARLLVVGRADENVFGAFDLATNDDVEFVGRLSDDDMAQCVRHARALVFPSLYEGFGIPPLEAIHLGARVLSSDIPPVREVCGPAVDYFQPDDPAQLAALMRKVLSEGEVERCARVAAAKSRLDHYSWARSAALILEHVRAAALGRRSGRRNGRGAGPSALVRAGTEPL